MRGNLSRHGAFATGALEGQPQLQPFHFWAEQRAAEDEDCVWYVLWLPLNLDHVMAVASRILLDPIFIFVAIIRNLVAAVASPTTTTITTNMTIPP